MYWARFGNRNTRQNTQTPCERRAYLNDGRLQRACALHHVCVAVIGRCQGLEWVRGSPASPASTRGICVRRPLNCCHGFGARVHGKAAQRLAHRLCTRTNRSGLARRLVPCLKDRVRRPTAANDCRAHVPSVVFTEHRIQCSERILSRLGDFFQIERREGHCNAWPLWGRRPGN